MSGSTDDLSKKNAEKNRQSSKSTDAGKNTKRTW